AGQCIGVGEPATAQVAAIEYQLPPVPEPHRDLARIDVDATHLAAGSVEQSSSVVVGGHNDLLTDSELAGGPVVADGDRQLRFAEPARLDQRLAQHAVEPPRVRAAARHDQHLTAGGVSLQPEVVLD